MQIRELAVPGAFEFTPVQHGDSRGLFMEWFKVDALRQATGHSLELSQANMSVSKAGSLRGIHFADVPPGQAKYVTCPSGAVIDFIDLQWWPIWNVADACVVVGACLLVLVSLRMPA
jgi:dTDP-4-dehydrorhamnose 3,5-epimerase